MRKYSCSQSSWGFCSGWAFTRKPPCAAESAVIMHFRAPVYIAAVFSSHFFPSSPYLPSVHSIKMEPTITMSS